MNWFKKKKTELISFHTGTIGMKAHAKFIYEADKNGVEIIHAWTDYHSYSQAHIPASLNYVIRRNRKKLEKSS